MDDVTLEPGPGTLLIASPLLRDPNFHRTVVLLCEHDDEGSMGLVVNRPSGLTLEETLQGLGPHPKQDLWFGGPVQREIVVVLHRDVNVEGARTVADGMALGGDAEAILDLLRGPQHDRVRVFSGYAGWGAGQLEAELGENSWIVAPARADLVFATPVDRIWGEALRGLGSRYAYLADAPADPRVN